MTPAEQFEDLTIQLMCHKYLYYELNNPVMTDWDHDMLNQKWLKLGQKLGLLIEEETMPCIVFDEKHSMAAKDKALAETFKRKRL